jgi:16S rRNA (uracil1498-N3)-methyltransferase
MRKIRVHVDTPLAGAREVVLPAFAAEHLTRVLRLPDGAAVTCFDGDGHDYAGILRRPTGRIVLVELGTRDVVATESPLTITLLQAIARGEKMDLVLQKATELGVARIVPLVSERTEVKLDEDKAGKRLAHWQRVVRSACEQCGRAVVPVVDAPLPMTGIGDAGFDGMRLALHPDATEGIAALFAESRPTAVTLAVGPEGGFGERDLAALAHTGFRKLRLGPRVLRTETAGLAALAALQVIAGDLG